MTDFVLVLTIIQSFFLLGAILYGIAQRKQVKEKRSGWSKYFSYMLIVNIIAYSINKNHLLFRIIVLFILIQGALEIIRALKGKGKSVKFKFYVGLVYSLLAAGFLSFTNMATGIVIWTYLAIFLFDGFSQLSGQLFGKKKLAPSISPNKTVGGLIGGGVITLTSVYFMAHLAELSALESLILGALICFSALTGDLLASWLKRQCGIKDYGQLLPGHGGVLDRFDSFVFSGALMSMVFSTPSVFFFSI
jgi:phosphatidate cytidylyltransferase